MDEREVRAKSDALQKALSGREPPANVLNLLKDLQKGVKPSEELLRKTQVGKIVNKVKSLQGVDPAIPRLAAEIVSQWRNQVQGGKKTGASTPTQQNGNASPVPSSKSATQAPPAASSSSSNGDSKESKYPTGVALDKRTWKTDGIKKGDLTAEPGRNNSIGLLYDGLVSGSDLPPQKVLSVARAVEHAIINLPDSNDSHTTDFYKEKVRSLYQNLKNKSHPELRTNILSGKISPEKFATMTHEEMKSKKQKDDEAKIAKENFNNAMVPKEERSISDHLECGKCRKKMVSFTQAQTRSADEPMTTFCTCENCGNRWKFS